jgi:hypothetical protein
MLEMQICYTHLASGAPAAAASAGWCRCRCAYLCIQMWIAAERETGAEKALAHVQSRMGRYRKQNVKNIFQRMKSRQNAYQIEFYRQCCLFKGGICSTSTGGEERV